jgi:stress-induced morphogen
MNFLENLKEILLREFPDSLVEIQDLKGDGQHISCFIQSSIFKEKTRVEQHRLVYKTLKSFIGEKIHAVVIKTAIY